MSRFSNWLFEVSETCMGEESVWEYVKKKKDPVPVLQKPLC